VARSLRLEARLSLAVGCTLALTLAAVGLGVLVRVHGETAGVQRAALEREAVLGAAALQAGARALPPGEPKVALFVGGRRVGAPLPVPSPLAVAHAGDAAFRRWSSLGGRLVLERGVQVGGVAGVLEAASAVPGQEERALYRIEAEALVPILLGLLGGAMVLFAHAARRHRARLLAIADVAGRIGEGDLAARLNERGSDELAQVAASVDGLAGRLAQLEDVRHRSIARISHDLRSPLTVIKTYAHALRRGDPGPAQLERLAVIDDEVDRVTDLVDDLLAFARLRASALLVQPEPVDLAALVRGVVERRAAMAEERGVRLRCFVPDEPVPRMLDASRIGQVVANLVENALVHAHARTVEVVLEYDGDHDYIVVCDDGRGLQDAELPYLFDPFYHGAGSATGAGLGLAIARELTEAHGGMVEAENNPGRGARFIVHLPVATVDDAQEVPEC
jgi:signal transduction histidine kinase